MTYKEILERLQDVKGDITRLAEKHESSDQPLDAEDEARWATKLAEFEDLTSRKYKLEKAADRERVERADLTARLDPRGNAAASVRTERGADTMDSDPLGEVDSISETRGFRNPWNTTEIRLGMTPAALTTEYRSRAFSAIEQMQGTTPARREAMTQIIEDNDPIDARLSQQLLASSSPDYLRAFSKLARTSGQSHGLTDREREAVSRAMSLTDTAGGFLVPFQLDPTVILTSDGSYNDIRRAARKVIATGDVWHGVSAGAVSWSFDAEAAEVSDDTPTFAQPTVTVRTARGFVPISLEAYMDESNVAQTVGTLLAEGKDDLESVVFTTGAAGSNEPNGLITALVAAEAAVPGSVEVQSAVADTFGLADVYSLYNDLPARHRRRGVWLANNLIYTLTRQFDTAGGSALWAQLGQGTPQQLLGRPVYEAEAMDGVVNAAAENYVAVFGDMNQYVIADRIGMTVEFIPHLVGANRRPTGQRGWFAYYRVGADLVFPGALRLLNVT